MGALSTIREARPATPWEREKARWDEALRISRDYPVGVEAVRTGMDYVRGRAENDALDLSAADAEQIVRTSIEHALSIREPYPQYETLYILWKGTP